MLEVFGKNRPSVRTVERWYLKFWRGSFVLEDQPHTGRPSDVAIPESVNAVRKAITLNRRITYRQLEELLHIPKLTLERIVSEQLPVRKLCRFAAEVNFIVTGNEKWLYYDSIPKKS